MSRRLLMAVCFVFLGASYLFTRQADKGVEKKTAAETLTPKAAAIPAADIANVLPKAPSVPAAVTPAVPTLDANLEKARDLVASGKKEEALSLLEAAVQAAPENSEVRWHLGAFLQQEMKDEDGAVREFKAAYLANPDDPRALDNISASFRAKGNLDGAAKVFDELRQAQPKKVDPALALSDLYLDQNKPEQAMTVLKEAALANPDNPQISDRIAEAYGRKKDFVNETAYLAKTEASLERAIAAGSDGHREVRTMEHDKASLALDRAASLADQGRKQEALATLQGVSKQNLRKNDYDRFEHLWRGVSP